ncbi:aminotransferase class I/II-fold pyridoxal phosphate-dependent enzyme [Shimia sp. R9_1]|uniref:trans-sulfuration enzyme family protein n=1 Tax=Shimia sp. R9_1 TaxID=2821111 RepID=UPI001ADC33A9|nr:aminotransferase class I/II-fold pyridoxal phosphate-dependent enzyme [Shimia sp. R9_1]MBO9409117.1 aminotransferase class I/II-fold pyridoxal phosphate-dependent enzyme [Shimia sp. R9_1]
MDFKDMQPETVLAQAGGALDMQSGGVVPPIQPATTYARDENYNLLNENNLYSRPHNDVVRQAEAVLAQLEGGAEALLFPSGMAAIAALFRTVPTGGRVVVQSGIYWGTTKWIREFCGRRQVAITEVDASDSAALQAACAAGPAHLVWIETPSNPWLKVVDIAAAKQAADSCGALLAVDSTAASPLLSKPLTLGADIVMHSTTKVINGHSDVLGGVLVSKAATPVWEEIANDRASAGAVLGPFEAWLLLRGMRTLSVRVERMVENALKVARFLEDHPKVEAVLFPGLESHPQYELAQKQMPGGAGFLMSFLVKGDKETALGVAGKLKLFHRATSLGGVESLVEHRHTIESHTGIPETLLRISVGVESAEDLIGDLGQALGQ